MEMKKFAVISGFLGAGKTTAMMALTRYCCEHGGKAAMISNDLGEGMMLADHRLAQLGGCRALQITDECICFCLDLLAERLETCFAEGCELVMSDIPGFGVGALEHVYHGLAGNCPGRFELAPFTVLIEPHHAKLLRLEQAGDLGTILDAQLKEADLIVLSKLDLPDEAERAEELAWLAQRYPQAEILPLSAATGEGLDKLAQALREGKASLRHPETPISRSLRRRSGRRSAARALSCRTASSWPGGRRGITARPISWAWIARSSCRSASRAPAPIWPCCSTPAPPARTGRWSG